MKNILIPTKPDDQHAHFVKLALEKKGHTATLWYTADFPEMQTHSFEFNKNGVSWRARGREFKVNDQDEFDVVWWRRPRRPVVPEYVHPEDVENASYENMELYKTFWHIISPKAFWVNPTSAAKECGCKLLQLKVARNCGLNVPETLISNEPQDIKRFISDNGVGNTVFKPLFPVIWISKEDTRLTYTKEIRLDMLPSDKYLQTTAGIFQQKISKAYELRVNIFGNTCVTAKLASQEHPEGKDDWRKIPNQELSAEEYQLPGHILARCKLFMRKMGLAMGCFDFIVTPEGDYYFLEVNEQGQFLWIEDINPTIKMLDIFTDFLIDGTDTFTRVADHQTISIKDYIPAMLQAKNQAMNFHQAPATIY
jgi:glutathione synthase/RimK-type ligase-like ATP-grasp enzyme